MCFVALDWPAVLTIPFEKILFVEMWSVLIINFWILYLNHTTVLTHLFVLQS